MRIIIPILIIIVLELLVFKGAWTLTRGWARGSRLLMAAIFWGVTLTVMVGWVYTMANFRELRTYNPSLISFWMGAFFTLLIPQLIFLGFHLIDDVVHVFKWAYHKLFVSGPAADAIEGVESSRISRSDFISRAGLIAGGITFAGFLHGVTIGKYKYRVISQDIESDRIPVGLDGLKVVQISDLHLGSFAGNTEPAAKAVAMINALNADYIVFTGDMVNEEASEAEPFIEVFKGLKAKYGKYSIFGNHDYAHYGEFTETEEEESIKRLKEIHGEMGFKLMQDEHEVREHNGAQFEILGVHNWGRGFGAVGDLKKAMQGTDKERFQILLSHDPTHFEEEVMEKTNIDLTLSGHTHGLQMGIEIPALRIKFSPIQFVYKHWAGLYSKGKQMIYVNRGFGFLAFPGRVGIFPEITLLTLKSKKA